MRVFWLTVGVCLVVMGGVAQAQMVHWCGERVCARGLVAHHDEKRIVVGHPWDADNVNVHVFVRGRELLQTIRPPCHAFYAGRGLLVAASDCSGELRLTFVTIHHSQPFHLRWGFRDP